MADKVQRQIDIFRNMCREHGFDPKRVEKAIELIKSGAGNTQKAIELIKGKATDSAKRRRLHRALDAMMDSVKGRARDAESGPYDVGYMPKGGDPKGAWRDVVITASSWNDAMSKAKSGVRSGEELYRVSPRDKSAPWAK